jgi:hypothetical protein
MKPSAPDPEPPTASHTSLVSFVVRFVCDEAGVQAKRPATHWHGVIRHVQSDAEQRFSDWDEAVAFIAQYVDVTREA